MKLGIVGCRHYNDATDFAERLEDLQYAGINDLFYEEVDAIVSGGAKGTDTLARWAAEKAGFPFLEFNADWEMYGKKAGPIRNKKIVDAVDMIWAFWDGKSTGTKNTIDQAKKAGIPVVIFWIDEGTDSVTVISQESDCERSSTEGSQATGE